MTPTRSTASAVRSGLGLGSSVRPASIAAAVAAALGLSAASAALAQDDSSTAQQVQALKAQVEQLQRRLDEMQQPKPPAASPVPAAPQAKQTAAASHAPDRPQTQQTKAESTAAEPPHAQPIPLASSAAEAQPVATEPGGYGRAAAGGPGIQAGPLTLTFGGFTELATIYRNRNEVSDVGSDFNAGIPFEDNPQSRTSEFRESARQSRFAMLAEGEDYDGFRPEAYMETDFLSAGVTSNSRESNSYTLRVRNFYGRFVTDWGLDVTAGQNWSLATLESEGMQPRKEDSPITIDAQYVVGFNWTRNPQLRVVEHFSKAFSAGLSLESPQTVFSNGAINSTGLPKGVTFPPTYVNYSNSGDAAGLENNSTTYSTDPAPDVVAKVAADPGFGHYELYGLGRWFRSTVATRTPDTVSGGGVGAGTILPLAGKVLSLQVSGLVGKGIGRYGSGQMPDVTMQPDGNLSPISEYEVLVGLIFKPVDAFTAYAYGGREQESKDYFTFDKGTYGYGAPVFNNSGCYSTDPTLKCVANIQSIQELTGGFWWKYYEGELGNLQFGLQLEYLDRIAFYGKGGAPSANIFMGMASFRYYPYQK
jgi:hypothetical protein